MTESMEKNQDMELLSQLLDELNAGQQPECEEPELDELVAVAAMLKQAGTVAKPPQHLLDQTVDKILAEQSNGQPQPQKRSWFWRNPSILGAAASLLLVVGLQLYPSWNSSEVQSVTAPAPVVEKREAVSATAPPQQAAKKAETIPSAAVREEAPAIAVAEKAAEPIQETAPAANPVSEKVTQPSTGPAAVATPETAKKAPVLREQTPMMSEKSVVLGERAAIANKSGSAFKAAAFGVDDPADRWPLPILSLPGQAADELSRDQQTGTVRQVFWKGTTQEVIVTQRMLRQEEKAAKPSTLTGSIEDKAGAVNSVTVILYNQEITVEGSRPEAELLKIAKQLTL